MAATSRREPLIVEGRHQASDTRGERQLAWAVLETAFNDLSAEGVNQISKKARYEARLFCTALDGEWAVARRKWCDLAELDEGSFVRKAQSIVDALPIMITPPAPPRVKKTYSSRGDNHITAKMTEVGVREMRAAMAEGASLRSCARRWEMAKSSVEAIRDHRTWAHVQ